MRRSAGAPDAPAPIDSAALDRRCTGLATAAHAAAGRLPDGPVRQAQAVLGQVAQRRRLAEDLTVVALAGPTGAGKSTLFNALVGQELARVAVTRPTTGEPTAALWTTPESAGALLDWLGVKRWHVVTDPGPGPAEPTPADPGSADPAPADTGRTEAWSAPGLADLAGLVLLDLPDHDSTIATHREQVDLLMARVDIMVWVLDPQKYADALVHDAYLAQFARHDDVTIVLLNQADRLEPADARAAREHLGALVAADGLTSARVLGVSARTGAGLD
ncbi:MAG: GTPase, partial [Candidatus Nanopelagicales bacterium]